MICPGCKSDITCSSIELVAQKFQCEDCNYIGIPDTKRQKFKFPNTYLGFIYFILYFISIIFLINSSNEYTKGLEALDKIVSFSLYALFLYYVYSLHHILEEIAIVPYPIYAGKSVWGHFIPFYNLAFIFIWPNEFVRFYNKRQHNEKLLEYLGGVIYVIAFILNYTYGIGVLLLFGLITYYTTKLKSLVENEIDEFKSLPLSNHQATNNPESKSQPENNNVDQNIDKSLDLEKYQEINDSDLTDGEKIKMYGKLFGLKGKISKGEIKIIYRQLIEKYHPDKVNHLGLEFQIFAEKKTKDINKAYAFFKKKYNL